MTLRKKGFKELRNKLQKLGPAARIEFDKVNEQNAKDVADLAKVLISSPSGRSRGLIKTTPAAEGGTLIDFGPIAKILEGGTEQRTTKTGANRGSGPARPFVNPSFKATQSRRRASNTRN